MNQVGVTAFGPMDAMPSPATQVGHFVERA
jgi:hypothetical protein